VRWGCGISYHEFELGLGSDVHAQVIADGWEPEINAALGILAEDLMTELQLKTFAPHVHRAFARRTFYFIARKPDVKAASYRNSMNTVSPLAIGRGVV
jgi:hypothetical protein